MATLEQGLFDRLSTDTVIASIVGSEIVPLSEAQDATPPYITYTITNTSAITHLTGEATYRKAQVELGIFAVTYDDCIELCTELRRRLHLYDGTTSNVEFAPAQFDDDEGESDIEQLMLEGQEVPTFYRIQKYKVLYKLISS